MNPDYNSRFDELELLNLKSSEKKIILAISKMGRSIAQISRETKISQSSLQYMIKKLFEKSLVFPVKVGKRKFWRSNIPKILLYLKNIQTMKKS